MRNNSVLILILILLVILGSGCTGRTDPGGAVPDISEPQAQSYGGRTLWGFWDITVDTMSGTADVVPLRGVMFTANVNQLLEGKSGNLIIKDLDLTDYHTTGRLDCTVMLRHPFPGLDMYNGFDVWGVFMHNGSTGLIYDGLVYSDGSGDNEAVMLNPDGFARWFNYPEFSGSGLPILKFWPGKLANLPNPSAMLNPYKIFADGLEVEDDFHEWVMSPGNADDRGMFSAGSANSRRYELQFPMGATKPILKFQYAVIAGWEPGDPGLTGNPLTYEVGDFPSDANCEEAFFVDVETASSDLFFVDNDNRGGTFKAGVEVFDWQGGTVGGNGVPAEVESIIVEGNFLTGGTHKITHPEIELIAMPSTDNSSVFEVEISNCMPVASGDTGIWIMVEAAGEHGESYDQEYEAPFPDDARRAAFLPSSVIVGTEPPIPPEVVYNFEISANRTGTGMVIGTKLEWDEMPPNIAGVNIYKKSAYEPGSEWGILPASPVDGTEYIDSDVLGYEGYMYYIAVTNGYVEGDPSQTAFILFENAEETINTFSVWEDDYRLMGAYYQRWGPLGAGTDSPPPANGSFSWDESAIENFPTPPGDYWTGFWMLLCSPELPIEPGTSTAYVEFMHRVETYDWSPPKDSGFAGGKVGVCTDVDRNAFWPSDEYRSGFQYPATDVPGLYYWGQFPNCGDPEAGFGGQHNTYQLSGYNVSDVFIMSNPRVGFAFGSVNSAFGYGWNVDDIVVVIY